MLNRTVELQWKVTPVNMFKIHCIVFGHLWILAPLLVLCCLECVKMYYCPKITFILNLSKFSRKRCFWDRNILVCFRVLLRCKWNICGCTVWDAGVNKSLKMNSWINANILKYIKMQIHWFILNLIKEQI